MIELKNVSKKFGKKQVLNNLSFTAKKGDITCLIGINGVGKTTIMKSIMALTPIHGGEILIDGEKISKNSFEKITFIPDSLKMPSSMTIDDALTFMADFYTSWNEQRAIELLQFFKLNLSDRIRDLSKGNAAKVNLLLGLALDVDYILMDEPFSGIDLFARANSGIVHK